MDSKKKWRALGGLGGGLVVPKSVELAERILTAVGLVDLPEQWQKWGFLLKAADPLAVMGLLFLVLYFVGERNRNGLFAWALSAVRRPQQAGDGAALQVLLEHFPEARIIDVQSGDEVEYRGAKTPVLSVTLAELEAQLKGQPSFRRDEILKPYLEKWLPVEGAISDISKWSDHWSLRLGARLFWVHCRFDSGENISHAVLGDRARLIGRFAGFGFTGCELHNCVLLAEIGRPPKPQAASPASTPSG